MAKKKIYAAIFDDGRRVRFFKSLVFMCEQLHLDYDIVWAYLNERGWWVGLDFTVFAGDIETPQNNYGKL